MKHWLENKMLSIRPNSTTRRILSRAFLLPAWLGLAVACSPEQVDAAPGKANPLCATYFEKQLVRNAYFGYGANPAAVPPVVSHSLRLLETKVVSSFSTRQSIGTQATPDIFKDVWQTIEAWGTNERVNIVLTVDGWHGYSFPSLVPSMTPPENTDGKPAENFFSLFADGGKGVHAHIDLRDISLIFATKLEANNGKYLRSVNFYNAKGDLVFAVYATEPSRDEVKAVVDGYEKTWTKIAAMPRACKTQ